MKISIAMTTFNGSKYLHQQLSSFLIQDYLPDELIICDDGSSDNTMEILKEFSESAPFSVKIFKNKTNLGFTKNFEKTIKNCSGDIILLSDQDDKWFSNKISSIIDFFKNNPTFSLVIHDAEIVDDEMKYHGANTLRQALVGYGNDDVYITGALSAMKKEIVNYALPFPQNLVGHDGWIHDVGKILDLRKVINVPLGIIRRHQNNTSGWIASSATKINYFHVLIEQIKSIFLNHKQEYKNRMEINKSLTLVLERYAKENNKYSLDLKEKKIFLLKESQALVRRNNLQSSSFIVRKLKAIELLFRGDYAYFNNLKSFIRDMLR